MKINQHNNMQYAYKRWHSIYNAINRLLKIMDNIDAIHNVKERAVLVIDIKQASDYVNRHYLLNQLCKNLNCQSTSGIIYDLLNVSFNFHIFDIKSKSI